MFEIVGMVGGCIVVSLIAFAVIVKIIERITEL